MWRAAAAGRWLVLPRLDLRKMGMVGRAQARHNDYSGARLYIYPVDCDHPHI